MTCRFTQSVNGAMYYTGTSNLVNKGEETQVDIPSPYLPYYGRIYTKLYVSKILRDLHIVVQRHGQ